MFKSCKDPACNCSGTVIACYQGKDLKKEGGEKN